jgi:hypothetical protein
MQNLFNFLFLIFLKDCPIYILTESKFLSASSRHDSVVDMKKMLEAGKQNPASPKF